MSWNLLFCTVRVKVNGCFLHKTLAGRFLQRTFWSETNDAKRWPVTFSSSLRSSDISFFSHSPLPTSGSIINNRVSLARKVTRVLRGLRHFDGVGVWKSLLDVPVGIHVAAGCCTRVPTCSETTGKGRKYKRNPSVAALWVRFNLRFLACTYFRGN